MGVAANRVRLKRAYEPASPEDGTRVLVERLWPRGVSKAEAALDDWAKEIAPSPELRKWYAHEDARWPEFRRRYLAELAGQEVAVEALRAKARAGRLTLVLAAQDVEHSSAAVLRDVLLRRD
jgi:uncharacterized protein YeaO (DUF488 family)